MFKKKKPKHTPRPLKKRQISASSFFNKKKCVAWVRAGCLSLLAINLLPHQKQARPLQSSKRCSKWSAQYKREETWRVFMLVAVFRRLPLCRRQTATGNLGHPSGHSAHERHAYQIHGSTDHSKHQTHTTPVLQPLCGPQEKGKNLCYAKA